jgi:8-oxo-dGTP diphosphatase
MFNEDELAGQLVEVIKKNHPAWQAGRFNGIGGHIEAGESALSAMIREFHEETGCKTDRSQWTRFTKLSGDAFTIDFFFAYGDLSRLKSTTDEEIEIMQPFALTVHNSIPNLTWLVPMALSMAFDQAGSLVIEERKDGNFTLWLTPAVYLSGGIAGLSADGCNGWRKRAAELLNCSVLDPMRWERDGRSHSPNDVIVQRDLRDIDECAALLVKVDDPSWGTAMEVRYAYQLGLPIIAFGSPKMSSAWLEHHCDAIYSDLEQATTALNLLLKDVKNETTARV